MTQAQHEDAEIGGILFGRRESDDRISIEDFELLSSEHRRGMTFTLSAHDRRRLAQRLRASHRGLQPLGSFRTHLRQGIYMDQYDLDLMSLHFPSATDVMLLIRPKDSQAGFFVWEDGDINRQKSYREFTFDPAALPLTMDKPAAFASTPMPKPRATPPQLPTLAKVALMTATAGLVGVLAFFTHQHRVPQPLLTLAANRTEESHLRLVNPPVDPDVGQPENQYELHVKIPHRPSPFAKPEPQTQAVPQNTQKTAAPPQPAAPPEPPPLQVAVNTPIPAVPQTTLRPVQPALISEVSLEPAQPGVLKRGLHHVPVLNLLEKHNYKSGNDFAPARPVREFKPRLPDSPQHPNVDVKVWIDETGQVTRTELLSERVDPDVAEIASNAAGKWTFQPARVSDRPVSSEMVMHFRFVPK